MGSPFPGMEPYLEGYLWPDVHQALAAKMRQVLTPLVRPKYTARLNVYVIEDMVPEGELGIVYPDVEVTPKHSIIEAPTPALLTIPVYLLVEIQLTNVEIRDAAQHQLITAIEILSPVNKRHQGLKKYRRKR